MCRLNQIKYVQIPQGDWVKAIESLTELILEALLHQTVNESRLVELYNLRGECYYRLHEYNSSRRDCDLVLKYDSNNIGANERQVKCLFGLKQYQLADEKIQELTKLTPESTTSTSTNNPYSSLILLQKRIKLEQEGEYNMDQIRDECAVLYIPDDLASRRNELCVRLGPHGEYIHPGVQFVPVPKKGYGLRMNTTIAKGTLIIASKAIFVHLVTDQQNELEMYKRKLKDQPDLILQVQRIFSKPQYADRRSELVKQINPIQLMNQPISIEPKSNTLTLKDLSDHQLESSYYINRFGATGGTSLGFIPSLFNHSCLPNCGIMPIGDFFMVHAITAGPILAGSELTISYKRKLKLLPFSKRRIELGSWFDHCDCELCAPFHVHPELIRHEDELFTTTLTIRSTNQQHVSAKTVTSSQLISQIKVLEVATEDWIDIIRRNSQSTSSSGSESESSSSDSTSSADSDSFELSDSTLSVSLVRPYRLQRDLITQLVRLSKSELTDKDIRQWHTRKYQIWNKLYPILNKYQLRLC